MQTGTDKQCQLAKTVIIKLFGSYMVMHKAHRKMSYTFVQNTSYNLQQIFYK